MMTDRRPALFLERALIFSLVIHGLAMLSMALLLMPGIPGGGADLAARMAYVADNPWLWRLGWLPWQLTALSDLLIAIALLRTRWIDRRAAWLTLLFTVAAILPEQTGEFRWVTEGVALARTGSPAAYGALEASLFTLTSVWGAFGYTLAALGWTWAFAAAGIWRPWLTWLSAFLWPLFGWFSGGLLLPEPWRPPLWQVGLANGVGFTLLLPWMGGVLELLLRRSRPDTAHGRYVPWVCPTGRKLGKVVSAVADSRLLRALAELLPVPAMRSDIRDVIYANYLVPAERLAHLVPDGLELQRLGAGGEYALFTFLTYRHGHFGPAFLGPLRRRMPSPLQSNWRIYVTDPRTGRQGVYFITTAITSLPHALGARILSEGLPMHLVKGELAFREGAYHLALEPGVGSGPDARGRLRPADGWRADGPWRACFASPEEMLAYAVPQDRAFSVQPWYGRVTRQEIDLGIPLTACEPLEGAVTSRLAGAIAGDAEPFCFRVAEVSFRFEREEHETWEPSAAA